MEKILKKEIGLSRKNIVRLIMCAGIFLALSYYIFVSLYSNVKTIVTEHAVSSITNISQLNEESITRAITNRKALLETIAERLERRGIYEIDGILDEMEDFSQVYDCYGAGVLTEEHMVYRVDGTSSDVSGMELTRQIWDDEFHVSESYYPSGEKDYMVNIFSVPVYENGELKYVLTASYYSKTLTERMNTNFLGEKGYTFLIDSQSKVVIYPQHYEDPEYNRLMKYIDDSASIVPNEEEDTYFEYDGDRYYAHFEKLNYSDWYLLTCAKESDVFARANKIADNVFAGMSLLWIMVAAAGIIIVYSFYSSRKKLHKMAYYDSLLGIGNRNAAVTVTQRLPKKMLSEMYLVVFDIDKFKEFNYLYGDDSGDRLLKYIVRVFQEEVPDVYLFRYMSDYFVTLDHSRTQEELEKKIQKTLDRFARDIESGEIQPFATSAGVRKYEVGESLPSLFSDAMIAREQIKKNHLRQYAFYDEVLRQKRIQYMEMESNFSKALRDKEFHVYYQPKYDMNTGKMIGAEALARWIRADGRIISPKDFVPCFEESHQIYLLDSEILSEVCRQMKEMEADGLDVKIVSVNLSRVHLRQNGILPKIEKIIRESGIDASRLSFEITESALYEDSIPLKNIIDFLHGLGCKVDMDDYGVGVSGPNALATNQFDMIKLDKTFVDGIGNQHTEDVIQSTILLAKKWGIDILAEGVEEKYQMERLVELGCTLAQGYYYSKPVPEEEYRKLLKMES